MTSSKYPDRDRDTLKMLTELGFNPQRFDGGITTPYTIGVAKGHLQALQNTKLPALLIEDDARLIGSRSWESRDLDIFDGMDALYLGTSIYGRIEGQTAPGVVISTYTDYGPGYVRIYNMLSMHAILYLSENYKNSTIALLEDFIKNPIGGVDDKIADLMPLSNIYCVKNPIFYQNDGHSDEQTKQVLWPKI